jgi:cytoskeleton protein RodZ
VSIGAKFRAERERQGVDLDTVAEATKIRRLYLTALEADDYQELPPRVYATGFVANYARFLHMDPDTAVQEFKSQAYEAETVSAPVVVRKKKVRKRIVRSGGRKNSPLPKLLAAALFLVLVWWLGTYIAAYIAGRGIEQQPVEPISTPGLQGTLPAVEQPDPANSAATLLDQDLQLVITAREACWLEVKADKIGIYTGTMAPGEQRTFTGRDSVYVRAGNAGGIELSLNGRSLGRLGGEGQVATREFTRADVGSTRE